MLGVSQALAQEASGLNSSGIGGIMPIIIIIVIFYFLIFRPQQKKMKAHTEMTKNLSRGDRVITAGGVYGKVSRVREAEDVVEVEIAKDVVIDVQRSTITELVTRTEPVNDDVAPKKPKRKSTSKKKAS